jgi:predicted DsbA family dithiol-disulfide isomerase
MPYSSTITFTLDTICPWTYLAFLRLRRALQLHSQSEAPSPLSFDLRIAPYQLYPAFPASGTDKYEWYKNERFDGSEERMGMYVAEMTRLGREEGVEMDFGGEVAGTFEAHRVLQYIQEEKGGEVALKVLESLYEQYFCQQAHPSSPSTLITACLAAGLSHTESEELVNDGDVYARQTKAAIQEQAGNGVDSVPYVVFEGRKRDFTLIGAKTVEEYGKVLGRVEKEAL